MDQMRRVKTALLLRDPEASLADVIATDRSAFSGLRVLFASDVAGVTLEQLFEAPAESIPVAPLFCGKGLLAFSDQIAQQMLSGQAPLFYGSRTLLDTNFLSELPRFYECKEYPGRERIEEILGFIDVRMERTVEWTFACLENLREAVKPNNPWPWRKVAAARFFCEEPAAFVTQGGDPSRLEKYLSEADEMWRTWLGSPRIWQILDRRDFVYAIVLKSMLECWAGSSVSKGLGHLVDYCLSEFGLLPLKELYFGWKALSGFENEAQRLPIFNEKALTAPGKHSLGRVSAVAWDLFLFRWCESLMTQMHGNSFYLPTVTTLDAGLLDAIRSCPLRAVIIHDEAEMVETLFDDELAFQEALNASLSQATLRKINDPERQLKMRSVPRHALSTAIRELETALGKLF